MIMIDTIKRSTIIENFISKKTKQKYITYVPC